MKNIQAQPKFNFHLFDFSLLEEVCLIDDEHSFLFLNQMIFKDTFPKLKVISYNNIKDAFVHLQNNNDIKRLVILDINLGYTTGFELLDLLNPFSFKNLNVIIHSSCTSNKNIEKAFTYPLVKAFIEKPLFVETIELISGKISSFNNKLDCGGAIFTRETFALHL